MLSPLIRSTLHCQSLFLLRWVWSWFTLCIWSSYRVGESSLFVLSYWRRCFATMSQFLDESTAGRSRPRSGCNFVAVSRCAPRGGF
ncbi:hypothetical protein EDB86DRAFT_2948429 [Lactarius hatsudake]|nr:hypothetical protein EDB86DRAFT_2948429 [Lactarius hatsudake]